jgi:lipid-A-disaccharide synthase
MDPNCNVIVSAGELSSDMHLAGVIKELRKNYPNINIEGFGGDYLSNQGVNLIAHINEAGGIMGFSDVLRKLSLIKKILDKVKSHLIPNHTKLLIVCDYADFNLKLCKDAHRKNIPVLYFIPPKVWVWRKSRINLLKKYCNKIASIFNFEFEYLKNHNLSNVEFVGHPFLEEQIFSEDKVKIKEQVCLELNLDKNNPLLLVLIGSRKSEVKYHLEVVVESIRIVKQNTPNLQVIFAKAKSIPSIDLPNDILNFSRVSEYDSRKLMMASDAGIIKSGTSTLEATFAKLPFICIYKAPKLTELFLRIVTNIKDISLPNLILPNSVKELVQDNCNPNNIAESIRELLSENNGKLSIDKLSKVVDKLGLKTSCYKNVAVIASDLLNKP